MASTPNNVALGGTQFADGTGGYWDFWWHKGGATAKSYFPEAAWNESGLLMGLLGHPATGGGPSAVHAKPSWQQAPGVPADGRRDVPDLSLAAAQYAGTGPKVFHDILTGNNSIPGTPGFACGPGYDLATGLGSLDAKALVEAWPAAATPAGD